MTREEAIKVLEKQFDKSCGNYRYQNAEKLDFEDALWVAISALRQQDHFREVTKKVDPLTLDELREMEGQPVYIVENTEYWAIVNSFDQAGVYLLSYGNPDDYGYFGLYGKTWLAYRQKPEEDDHD